MKYIIANWKMNMTFNEVNEWINAFTKKVKTNKPLNNTVILAPSCVHIPFVYLALKGYKNIKIAAQNVATYDMGAHTGSVGVNQLKDFCEYCILGHSELKENTELTMEKAKKCLEYNIKPIICSVNPLELITNNGDKKSSNSLTEQGLLAWEDPSNISKNGVYHDKPIDQIAAKIDDLSNKLSDMQIIYGGSVNEKNSQELAKIDKLSGVLVGNASLDPEIFWNIISDFENN